MTESDGQRHAQKKKTMIFDLSEETMETIDELARSYGTNRTDVLRKAITLLKTVKKGEQEGQTAAMIQDGKVVVKIVGL